MVAIPSLFICSVAFKPGPVLPGGAHGDRWDGRIREHSRIARVKKVNSRRRGERIAS
jgi:hypothetical protein